MVAGKAKKGELRWETALRELREETSLTPTSFFSVPVANRFYEWETDTLHEVPVFLALVKEKTFVLDDEHTEGEWVGLEEGMSRLDWPGQRAGLLAAWDLLDSPILRESLEIALS